MITVKDIEHLSKLSRIGISDSEKERIASEIESILSYVKQVSSASDEAPSAIFENVNSVREDVVTNDSSQYSESLLSLSPQREGNYFKVKKILE
jgi:aspartyl-tRNA(Asn)/glutamyl-tRNA(Gln) amidotransferase subunit C